jgi:hypothetical protein
LNSKTCRIVNSAKELSETMLDLDQHIESRSIGWDGTRAVRDLCKWERFAPEFENWVDAVMESPIQF